MFDPFNDFQTAGYLRNVEGRKDPERIKKQEHFFFDTRREDALGQLKHGSASAPACVRSSGCTQPRTNRGPSSDMRIRTGPASPSFEDPHCPPPFLTDSRAYPTSSCRPSLPS